MAEPYDTEKSEDLRPTGLIVNGSFGGRNVDSQEDNVGCFL